MKLHKSIFYFVHICKMSFNNKLRFYLSIIGLFVGLFIFTTGNMVMDSYYNEKLKEALQMSVNVVVVEYESEERIGSINYLEKQTIKRIESVLTDTKSLIYAKRYTEDVVCTLSALAVGVSDMSDNRLISYGDNQYIMTETVLLKGRLINAADVAQQSNVVVIDELTENLLFPNGDSIGQQIEFDISVPGMVSVSENENITASKIKCTVIGVVQNSYNESIEEIKYKGFVSDRNQTLNLNTIIYMPITFAEEEFELSTKKISAWECENEKLTLQTKTILLNYKNQCLKSFSYYNVLDRNSVVDGSREQLNPIKTFLFIILIVLLIISGINTMSIMFFAIKERINEIGIKKALGATGLDILNQFVIEGILMAFFAAILAIMFGSAFTIILQQYLNNILYISFEADINIGNILCPVLIAVIYGFVFSIIPSAYGAKIKVTDSLRFE